MPSDPIRTTIRLDPEVHEALKYASGRSGQAAEAMIQDMLRKWLPRINYASGVQHPHAWGDLLAARFVQFLPALFVIKEQNGAVIYANPAYEREFKTPLSRLRGKPITDLNLTRIDRAHLSQDLDKVIQAKSAMESLETVILDGFNLTYRTIRYPFDITNSSRAKSTYIADFSFPLASTLAAKDKNREDISTEEICQHVSTWPVDDVESLCRAALEASPLSMAVKDASTDMQIVWANDVFFELAHQHRPEIKSRESLIGQTSKTIWKLDDFHAVVLNDRTVKATNTAGYFNEQLIPAGDFRTTARFPIPGKEVDEPRFIGAVSIHLRLGALDLAESNERKPRKKTS